MSPKLGYAFQQAAKKGSLGYLLVDFFLWFCFCFFALQTKPANAKILCFHHQHHQRRRRRRRLYRRLILFFVINKNIMCHKNIQRHFIGPTCVCCAAASTMATHQCC